MLTKTDLNNIKSLIKTETKKIVTEENKKQTATIEKKLARIEKFLKLPSVSS